jgi:hypothetical protein
MTFFEFGRHKVAMSDIHDINVEYRYQDVEIFVDLELAGGAQVSLNMEDSVAFLEQFIAKVRDERIK